jgi:hypothetical protein
MNKIGFWKIFGIGAGVAIVSSMLTSAICMNVKKVQQTFPPKKKTSKKKSN